MNHKLDKVDVFSLSERDFTLWLENNVLNELNKVQMCSYFYKVQSTIDDINRLLRRTSLAASTGEISRNPQLHGFLFEKLHAYTFNARAILAGKDFRAFVLPVDGGGFGKNSVDLAIYKIDINGNKIGHPLKVFQAKCCINPAATIKAFFDGDYRNQRLLVPNGQVAEVKAGCSASKTVTDIIEYDGIASTPQKYSDAKEIQNALLSGDFENIDWSMYSNSDLVSIGVQSVGKTVAVDALFRTVSVIVEHTILDSENSIKNDIKTNAKELGWDAAKAGVAEALSLAIAKKSEYVPKFLLELPNDMVAPVTFEIGSVVVDAVRAGYGYATGEYSEAEAYSRVIQSVIKSACAIGGGAIAGALSDGSLTIVGSVGGSLVGEAIVLAIGQDNFLKAAQGCIYLKNGAKNLVIEGKDNLLSLVEKEKNVLMEGI